MQVSIESAERCVASEPHDILSAHSGIVELGREEVPAAMRGKAMLQELAAWVMQAIAVVAYQSPRYKNGMVTSSSIGWGGSWGVM